MQHSAIGFRFQEKNFDPRTYRPVAWRSAIWAIFLCLNSKTVISQGKTYKFVFTYQFYLLVDMYFLCDLGSFNFLNLFK
jgi:hypothetical protein